MLKQKRVIVQFQKNFESYVAGERAAFAENVALGLSINPPNDPVKLAKIIGPCERDDSGLMNLLMGGDSFVKAQAENEARRGQKAPAAK